jgi:hypothetical protein
MIEKKYLYINRFYKVILNNSYLFFFKKILDYKIINYMLIQFKKMNYLNNSFFLKKYMYMLGCNYNDLYSFNLKNIELISFLGYFINNK